MLTQMGSQLDVGDELGGSLLPQGTDTTSPWRWACARPLGKPRAAYRAAFAAEGQHGAVALGTEVPIPSPQTRTAVAQQGVQGLALIPDRLTSWQARGGNGRQGKGGRPIPLRAAPTARPPWRWPAPAQGQQVSGEAEGACGGAPYVCTVAFATQGQRLHALNEQESVEGGLAGTNVTELLHPHADGKGHVGTDGAYGKLRLTSPGGEARLQGAWQGTGGTSGAEHLPEIHAVVAGGGLRKHGVATVAPIESAAIHGDAANGGACLQRRPAPEQTASNQPRGGADRKSVV